MKKKKLSLTFKYETIKILLDGPPTDNWWREILSGWSLLLFAIPSRTIFAYYFLIHFTQIPVHFHFLSRPNNFHMYNIRYVRHWTNDIQKFVGFFGTRNFFLYKCSSKSYSQKTTTGRFVSIISWPKTHWLVQTNTYTFLKQCKYRSSWCLFCRVPSLSYRCFFSITLKNGLCCHNGRFQCFNISYYVRSFSIKSKVDTNSDITSRRFQRSSLQYFFQTKYIKWKSIKWILCPWKLYLINFLLCTNK